MKLLLIISIILTGSISLAYEGKSLDLFSKKHLLLNSPSFKNYQIYSYKEKKNSKSQVEWIELWSKNKENSLFWEIHMKEFDEIEYLNFKNSNLLIIKNLYRATPSPYPGSLTKNSGCSTAPIEYDFSANGIVFSVLEGAASSRLVFGACENSPEKGFQGFLVLFKTKQFYSLIRLFIPYKDYLKNKKVFKTFLQSVTTNENPRRNQEKN